MCGFAGVITWDEKYRVTRETLEKMSRAIAHRGPDGEGFHLTRENEPITPDTPQVGLAFRRLAILDPDPRSNQPFHIGPLTLVFNGEIYNFRELKSEISKLRPDYAWRTTGDTEVLLMAYEVWAEKCVEKLNGMFAFAVWDERKKELFLARDRMGQKPLYWTAFDKVAKPWTGIQETENQSGDIFNTSIISKGEGVASIAFSSELGGLKSLQWINRDIDPIGMAQYRTWGFISAPRTIYQSIRKFNPAHWGQINYQQSSTSRYFDPNAKGMSEPSDLEDDQARQITRETVMQAVQRRLIADVPLGCFLSGGIDSSVIAACMSATQKDKQEVMTFSIGFNDLRYDETQYAQAVAAHLGTKHRSFVVQPDAANDLQLLANTFGEPFGDSSALPTHYLSRETRQYVKVALSGDGGDEMFGGYARYRAVSLLSSFNRLPVGLRKVAAAELWQKIPGSHPKSKVAQLKRFLAATGLDKPALQYLDMMQLFRPRLSRALLSADDIYANGQVSSAAILFSWFLRDRNAVEASLAIDRIWYLPDDLLTKLDRTSMLHALEVRNPFLDPDLVQFASRLRHGQLLKGGPKRMLREAFAKDLPDFVFKRKKMGFAVPIGEWFRGELRSMLRDNLFASDSFGRSHFNMNVVQRLVEEHEQNRVDHSQRLYALLMLELWWQQQRR